jgi:hypothetical protein
VFILAALLPMTLQGIVLRVCFAVSIVWGIAAPFAKGDMQTSVSPHAAKNCVRSKAMQMHGQVKKPFFPVYCTTSAPANCFSGCSGGISSPQGNDAMGQSNNRLQELPAPADLDAYARQSHDGDY